MAAFYGVLKGSRKPVTRCGHDNSGITATLASWEGAVQVHLYRESGVVRLEVQRIPWYGAGSYATLYDGPLNAAALGSAHSPLALDSIVEQLLRSAQAEEGV